jgi:hypothetical protein
MVLADEALDLAAQLGSVDDMADLLCRRGGSRGQAGLPRLRQARRGGRLRPRQRADGGDRAKAAADRAAFTRYAEGSQVPPAILSGDGKALLLSFPLAGGDKEQSRAATQVKQRLADGAPAGLRTALTGSAGAVDDIFDAFKGMDATLLLVTGAVVILLLLLTYRSPVLWLVPLLSVAVASQLASAAGYLLARHGGLTVDFQSQSVLTVLVFGVGVDYALLLVARYREELRRHPDRHEAMALALRRSFPAVLASAATVAAALLFLLAAELPSTRGLGPVGAVGIAAALVAMTTLLPALLVLGGRWLFWPFVPRYAASEAGHDVAADHGVWGRLARGVGRRPRPIWIGSAAALLVLTLGIGNLSIGLPAGETFTRQVGSVDGQHLVERHFPGGASAPADVLTTAASAEQVAAAARGVDGVAEVRPPERSADGRWARIPAVLAAAPESRAAKDAVDRLRAAVHAVPGSRALVGGDTAATLDTERTAARDDRVVMPLILAVVLLVLVVLLRALVAPLLLLASVVLTYAAALGRRAGPAGGRPPQALLRPAAAGVPVPGRPRGGLHHLPDDQGPGGGRQARPPSRRAARPDRHRRRGHQRRAGARRDLLRARRAAAGAVAADRRGRRPRRPARHPGGAQPAGPGARRRPRRPRLVAQPARAAPAPGRIRGPGRADPRGLSGGRAGRRAAAGAHRAARGHALPARRAVHGAGDLGRPRGGGSRRQRRPARRDHRHHPRTVRRAGRHGHPRVAGRGVARLPARPPFRRPDPVRPPRPAPGPGQVGDRRGAAQRARWPGGGRGQVRGRRPPPVPVVAGTVRMPYRRFVGWSAAGALAWSALSAAIGSVAGRPGGRYGDRLGVAGWAVLAALLVALLLVRAVRRRRAAAPRQGAGAASAARPHSATRCSMPARPRSIPSGPRRS